MHPSLRIGALLVTACAGTTLIALLVYATVQQTYRQGANDPQIQLADDAAAALRSGARAEDVVPRTHVDLATSLAPWVVVIDPMNRPLAASMGLGDRVPVPPAGALQLARAKGWNVVTWMPRRDVRSAIVARAVGDGRVVIAGRSLREVEGRELRLRLMVGLAWVALLVIGVVFAGFAAARSTDPDAAAPAHARTA